MAFVVVAALGTGLLWLRATYGSWWIGADPERIPLCEQTYTKRDDRELTYGEAVSQGPDPSPIVLTPTVGRVPLAPDVAGRFRRGNGDNGCGPLVLLRVGDDRYVLYFKLGGP